MDIQMPLLDGLAATRKIRALEASTAKAEYAALRGRAGLLPIIGLTAYARKEDEQASRQAGMSGFLTKPISKDKLAAVLDEHLAGIQAAVSEP
jgi:CheY-like chemotaxis protein